MNDWEISSATYLLQKYFFRDLKMEDITDTDYVLVKELVKDVN